MPHKVPKLYRKTNKSYLCFNCVSSTATSAPSRPHFRWTLSVTWMTLLERLGWDPACSGSSSLTTHCLRRFCGAQWAHTSTGWWAQGSGQEPARPSSLSSTACSSPWRPGHLMNPARRAWLHACSNWACSLQSGPQLSTTSTSTQLHGWTILSQCS